MKNFLKYYEMKIILPKQRDICEYVMNQLCKNQL